MGNNSMLFSMAILFILVLTVASKAPSGSKFRDLAEEEKEDGKTSEPLKAVPPSPPLSPPTVKFPATGLKQSSPPQSVHSPPNSKISDSDSSKSPPLSDNSAKLAPPPDIRNPGTAKQQEDKDIQSPLKKDDHKAEGATEKGSEKPLQSSHKDTEIEKGKAPIKAPEEEVEKNPQPLKDGTGSKGNEGISKSGNPDDAKVETCNLPDASNSACHIGALIGCLSQSGTKSVDSFFLVQNTGADDLKVNITVLNNKSTSKLLNLPKHSAQKVNFPTDAMKIILNAGEGDCVLQTRRAASVPLPFPQFTAYASQVRPVHGLLFLFATIVLAGGTWACCKLGKQQRKVDAGIPYQQLEMATHAQSAIDPASADRWDESWDDDWDDEEAVRPPAKQPAGNVSSNGLSSRSGNLGKDGWDFDWDD